MASLPCYSSILDAKAILIGRTLSFGAFAALRGEQVSENSPQLLMLSGVGAPDELAAHDIPVTVLLPGVGQNLQDHAAAIVIYARKEPGLLQRNMRLDRLTVGLRRFYLFGTGFTTDLPGGVTAFLKTNLAGAIPDTQLLFLAGPLSAAPYLPPFKPAFADAFATRIVLLHPESRGRVSLTSSEIFCPRIRIGAHCGRDVACPPGSCGWPDSCSPARAAVGPPASGSPRSLAGAAPWPGGVGCD